MDDSPKCRLCGRMIRYAQPPKVDELGTPKKFTCRDCRRAPVDIVLPLQHVIDRIGNKPSNLQTF